jgi:oxygen-dependent protoporphyrinogen oxidase
MVLELSKARVVVVGAGVSGLATATFLGDVHCKVLEAGEMPGGNVRTDYVDGRVIDRAANGWLDSEPAMDRMLALLGLSEQALPASDRSAIRWVYADGKMHAVPLSPPALLRTRLIPWWAKLRLLLEPFMPRRTKGMDETVHDFVSRRLGRWFVARMVGPMVAGIYAARPDQLSLAAAFPKMASMEKNYRSLFLAMLAKRRGGAPSGHLQSLPRGAGQLTKAMADRIGENLICNSPVEGLTQTKDGWRVHTPTGDIETSAVVLACPAPAQAKLVRGLDSTLAAALDEISYAPVTVVVTAWPAGAFDRSPHGFGVLVAEGEDLGVLGTLFTSEAYPSQSKEGEFLLRTMVGGSVDPKAAALPHQALLNRVFASHEKLLGTRRAEPTLVRIYRHPAGIPQYTMGHPSRVATVKAAQNRFGGLFFAGNHLQGIGVKDCVATGEHVANEVRNFLEITLSTEMQS